MQTAPFRTLCAMTLVAGVSCLADGPGPRRRRPTTAPGCLRGRRPARSRSRLRHARRQDRKTEKPPPKRLPRLRRLGLRPPRRVDRILRKTRPRRHAPRPLPIPRNTTRIPHQARCVNPVALAGGVGGGPSGACWAALARGHSGALRCRLRWLPRDLLAARPLSPSRPPPQAGEEKRAVPLSPLPLAGGVGGGSSGPAGR